MSFWSMPLPNYIKNSKSISSDEKLLFQRIMENRNQLGWCGLTNKIFAGCFSVSERTISAWVSNLERQGFINITNSRHNKERHIYCNIPKRAPAMPDYNVNMSIDDYLKIFTLAFPSNENDIQENITVEQANFLRSFRTHFPNKKIDCQITCKKIDNYTELMLACKRSRFVSENDNLGLAWVLANSEEIIAGRWKTFDDSSVIKSNFSQGRNYTREEMNACLQSIEDVEI